MYVQALRACMVRVWEVFSALRDEIYRLLMIVSGQRMACKHIEYHCRYRARGREKINHLGIADGRK